MIHIETEICFVYVCVWFCVFMCILNSTPVSTAVTQDQCASSPPHCDSDMTTYHCMDLPVIISDLILVHLACTSAIPYSGVSVGNSVVILQQCSPSKKRCSWPL